MSARLVGRRLLLALVVALLLVLAWGALSGAIRQLPRAHTMGQQLETAVQIVCGVLTVLVVVTSVGPPRRRRAIQGAWAASLAVAAGLSSMVWGPPMPLIALLLAALSLLAAWTAVRLLAVATR